MKDLKLATLSLVTASLIASNLIISKQYTDDTRSYENQIHKQKEIITYEQKELKVKDNNIKKNQQDITQLHKQLDELKKENVSLKKEWENEREVMNRPKFNVIATAYTKNCKGCSGKTFTGYNINNTIEYKGYRIIAADTRIFPLYSIVKIDTKKESFKAIVIDTGGAIGGYKIDLLVNSYSEAINFGRQKVKITVLK